MGDDFVLKSKGRGFRRKSNPATRMNVATGVPPVGLVSVNPTGTESCRYADFKSRRLLCRCSDRRPCLSVCRCLIPPAGALWLRDSECNETFPVVTGVPPVEEVLVIRQARRPVATRMLVIQLTVFAAGKFCASATRWIGRTVSIPRTVHPVSSRAARINAASNT